MIDTPAVLIDLGRVEHNLEEMASLATARGVALRPHIKTHKLPQLAQRQLDLGAVGLTCATLSEAEVMVEHTSVRDITIAFPILGEAKLRRLAALRERVTVRVVIDSVEAAEALSSIGTPTPVPVLLEVDTGLHRMGTPPGLAAAQLAERISRRPGVDLIGLSSHAGHAYRARTPQELMEYAVAEANDLTATLEACKHLHLREVSVGSTPTARASAGLPGITEIRPGTYVFNDVNQLRVGVATHETCALTVATTVIGRPAPNRVVVDAGAKVLALDGMGTPDWIQVVGRPDLHPQFLSEEHGVFTLEPGGPSLEIGEQLRLIPCHCCTVINLADTVFVTTAGEVIDEWQVMARTR